MCSRDENLILMYIFMVLGSVMLMELVLNFAALLAYFLFLCKKL